MALEFPLIDILGVTPVGGPTGTGEKVTEMRQGIGALEGSGTAAWHLLSRAGQPGLSHRHNECDEIIFHLSGSGIATQGEKQIATRPGHCRLIPKGVPHSYVADANSEDTVLIGFLPGVAEISADFDILGPVDPAGPVPNAQADDADFPGVAVHLGDVAQENMNAGDGWSITDFRLPISGHNASSSTLFRARFFPGAIHKKHRHDHCDEIYYIISGHGLAGAGNDRTEVRTGQFHYIPRGVEHWLHNLSETDPIEVVGLYVNADSVAATGYVYMGEVEAADLAQTSN